MPLTNCLALNAFLLQSIYTKRRLISVKVGSEINEFNSVLSKHSTPCFSFFLLQPTRERIQLAFITQSKLLRLIDFPPVIYCISRSVKIWFVMETFRPVLLRTVTRSPIEAGNNRIHWNGPHYLCGCLQLDIYPFSLPSRWMAIPERSFHAIYTIMSRYSAHALTFSLWISQDRNHPSVHTMLPHSNVMADGDFFP